MNPTFPDSQLNLVKEADVFQKAPGKLFKFDPFFIMARFSNTKYARIYFLLILVSWTFFNFRDPRDPKGGRHWSFSMQGNKRPGVLIGATERVVKLLA